MNSSYLFMMHSNFSLSSGFSKDMPLKIFTASGPMQCRNNATLYASGCEVIFMIIAQFCHAWLKVLQFVRHVPFHVQRTGRVNSLNRGNIACHSVCGGSRSCNCGRISGSRFLSITRECCNKNYAATMLQ